MQAPGGPDEDRDGGFEHGGWVVPHFDETMGRIIEEEMSGADAFLLGRKTYEIFAGSWPKSTDPGDRIALALNTKPKYVASRTLDTLEWNNSHLIKGDVAEEVAKLKAQGDGEIQVGGSSDLLQTLLKHDLVDEWHLWVFPVVLGSGKRLFGEGTIPIGLKLTRTETSSTGVTLQVYERAGAVGHGIAEVGEEMVVLDDGRESR